MHSSVTLVNRNPLVSVLQEWAANTCFEAEFKVCSGYRTRIQRLESSAASLSNRNEHTQPSAGAFLLLMPILARPSLGTWCILQHFNQASCELGRDLHGCVCSGKSSLCPFSQPCTPAYHRAGISPQFVKTFSIFEDDSTM